MEEVVGSIPTRSTNHLNNLGRATFQGRAFVSRLVSQTAILLLFARVSIAVRLASILRLTCSAIAMMVESAARFLQET